jgi:hypothetical protein
MATFSTWADELAALKNAISDSIGPAGRVAYGDKVIEYRSLDELQRIVAWYEKQAAIEAGTLVRRAYAKQGGRG